MIKLQESKDNGFEVIFSDIVTSKEMFDVGETFRSDTNFTNFSYILMWFIGVEKMLIDTDEIRRLAHIDKEASLLNPKIRFAVATDTPLVFGLARMWQSFYGKGPWKPMIFNEIEKARLFAYGKD